MTAPAKPVKRAATKKPAKVYEPGDARYDWRTVYPNTVSLFKFTSDDGFVVSLPKYSEPAEGEIFGMMLMNKSEQDLLIHTMRSHIIDNAKDPDFGLQETFRALQRMSAKGTIEKLLKEWPEASGIELGKS
jgi:hypothetical protein